MNDSLPRGTRRTHYRMTGPLPYLYYFSSTVAHPPACRRAPFTNANERSVVSCAPLANESVIAVDLIDQYLPLWMFIILMVSTPGPANMLLMTAEHSKVWLAPCHLLRV